MTNVDELAGKLASVFAERCAELNIPGASIALLTGSRSLFFHHGVTNLRNPLPVDSQTYFRIASVTKTFTALAAVLALSAADVPLGDPVSRVLGVRALSAEVTSADVTFEHLLTHTAGWDGDYAYTHLDVEAIGRADNATERLVDAISAAPQLTKPGELWHYNNSAFWVLALVLRQLTGRSYEDAVQATVLEPAGLAKASFFADEIITRRVSAGHAERGGVLIPDEPWGYPGPAAAASGGLVATSEQLAAYAQWWLRASRGEQDCSPAVAGMVVPRFPAGSICQQMGLGWMIDDVHGVRVVKHGGNAVGQQCRVTFIPELGIGLTVMANSHMGHLLEADVRASLLGHLLGYQAPWTKPAAAVPEDIIKRLPGEYASSLYHFQIQSRGDSLVLMEMASRGARQRRETLSPTLQRREAPPPAPPVELIHGGAGRVHRRGWPVQGRWTGCHPRSGITDLSGPLARTALSTSRRRRIVPMSSEEFLTELDAVIEKTWQSIESGRYFKHVIDNGYDVDLNTLTMTQIYHYVRWNPINQIEAAGRCKPEETDIFEYAVNHALEEFGHENFVVNDLNAMGIKDTEFLQDPPLPATRALIAYLRHVSAELGPVARLGYSYWAESAYDHTGVLVERSRKDLSLTREAMSFSEEHQELDKSHKAAVRDMVLRHATSEPLRAQVIEVAETSLWLTGAVFDSVLDAYLAVR